MRNWLLFLLQFCGSNFPGPELYLFIFVKEDKRKRWLSPRRGLCGGSRFLFLPPLLLLVIVHKAGNTAFFLSDLLAGDLFVGVQDKDSKSKICYFQFTGFLPVKRKLPSTSEFSKQEQASTPGRGSMPVVFLVGRVGKLIRQPISG